MNRIMELADAYAEHCVIAGFVCDNKAHAALQSEVSRVEAELESLRSDAMVMRVSYLNGVLTAKRIECGALRSELAAAQVDAVRYRWLRSTTNFVTSSKGERIEVRGQPEVWDAAIDAAILESKK